MFREALTEALQAANRYVFLVAKWVPSRRGMGRPLPNGAAADMATWCRWRTRGRIARNGELTRSPRTTRNDEMIRQGVADSEQAGSTRRSMFGHVRRCG